MLPVLVLALGAVLTPGTQSDQERVVKLNGPLPRLAIGEVIDAKIGPRGDWVAYLSNPDPDFGFGIGLYGVPLEGGRTPIKLSDPPAYWVRQFEISPKANLVVFRDFSRLYSVPVDRSRPPLLLAQSAALGEGFVLSHEGTRVAYLAQALNDPNRRRELVVRLIAGSEPEVELSGALSDPGLPRFAPEDGRVVFLASETDPLIDEPSRELFSTPSAGGAPVKLSGALVRRGDVQADFAISADGARVVYRADQDADERFELFSAPIGGGRAPVKLSAPLDVESDVIEFRIGPRGRRVVYRVGPDRQGTFALFSVPIDGSRAAVQLNPDWPANRDIDQFELTPDGRTVVYSADQEVEGRHELYRVPIDGGPAQKLSLGPVFVEHFALDPAGRVVVYGSHEEGTLAGDLSAVPISDPAAAVQLDSAGMSATRFRIAPDGRSVVFSANEEGGAGLFAVPIDRALAPTRLDAHPVSASAFEIDPTGRALLYRVEGELHSVPIDRSRAPIELSRPLSFGPLNADAGLSKISPDGAWCAFDVAIRDPESDGDGTDELYSVPLDRSRDPVRLYPPPAQAVDIGDLRITPDSAHLLFRAGSKDLEYFDLFSVPIDGRREAVRLNDPRGSYSGVTGHEITPDGRHVVFNQDVDDVGQLYLAPVDGATPALRLTHLAPTSVFGAVRFRLAHDGRRVVYVADGREGLDFELFSLPLDGSSAPVRLNDVQYPLGYFGYDLRFSADGTRVVYVTDQDVDDVYELYSVPVDGSSAPVRLSSALVPGGDVLDFKLAGTRVVYRADAAQDGTLELYSAPVDGSSAPVQLSRRVPASSIVTSFLANPDGTRVVYLSLVRSRNVAQLFSVPTDGSCGPRLLNGALAPGGSVRNDFLAPFLISPDGKRVVYRADQAQDEVFELFSVPIDRSSAPIRISGALAPGGDVSGPFQISPDGRSVLYLADQRMHGVAEVFRAPIDSADASERVSAPMPADGDVWFLSELTPDSERVLYVADPDTDGVNELYLAGLWFATPPPVR